MTKKGFLIVNEFKEREAQPDFKGRLKIGSVEYDLAGWDCNSAKTGKAYISLVASIRGRQSVQETMERDK